MPGLNDIQLPDALLVSLYKDTLIAPDGATPSVEKKATAPIASLPGGKWYLGDNAKGIAILVQDQHHVYLADESLQLLSGILAACKLNLGDVAIVNQVQITHTYQQLRELLQAKYFLLFDISTQSLQLPFSIPLYQVQQYDECAFLTAPDLQQLNGSTPEAKLAKSKLWLSLKNMFGL